MQQVVDEHPRLPEAAHGGAEGLDLVVGAHGIVELAPQNPPQARAPSSRPCFCPEGQACTQWSYLRPDRRRIPRPLHRQRQAFVSMYLAVCALASLVVSA
jgi:hypothetical protein